MRHSLPLAALLFASLLVPAAGCGEKSADRAAPAEAHATTAASPAALPVSDGAKAPSPSRALRITTETTLASSDVFAAVEALRAKVASAGGYVSDARTAGSGESKSADLEARIPADKLAAFRAGLAEHGDVLSDTEKAEDVTEQRADLKARLRNARAQEQRLLSLLSDRTGNLADVIAAEKSLGEVRDLVERLEAQEKLLEGQIAFATVKIHVVQKGMPDPETAMGKISAAGSKGVTALGQVAVGLAVAGATAGPTVLFLLAAFATLFYAIRKLSARMGWNRIAHPPRPAVMAVEASSSSSGLHGPGA
jgi:hypothetical protein